MVPQFPIPVFKVSFSNYRIEYMHIFTGMTKITSISMQCWTHRRIHIQLCTLITTFVLYKLLAFLSHVTPVLCQAWCGCPAPPNVSIQYPLLWVNSLLLLSLRGRSSVGLLCHSHLWPVSLFFSITPFHKQVMIPCSIHLESNSSAPSPTEQQCQPAPHLLPSVGSSVLLTSNFTAKGSTKLTIQVLKIRTVRPALQRRETRKEERKQPVWKPGIYSIQKKMLKMLLCVCVQYLLWY